MHRSNPTKKVARNLLKKIQGLMCLGALMGHKELKFTQGRTHLFKNGLWDLVSQ